MKQFIAICLSMLLIFSLGACSSGSDSSEEVEATGVSGTNGSEGSEISLEERTEEIDMDIFKAALLINGNLGDKSFFDSAKEGLDRLKGELGDSFDYVIEEMGTSDEDSKNWESTVFQYCESGEYDVIICSSSRMQEIIAEAAANYPEQKFIYYDEKFNYDEYSGCDLVYNVLFKQNEVSFLVGAAAALMTTNSDYEKVDPQNAIIGFLGGEDTEVINDFLVGYIEGAKYINPDILLDIDYVGDYENTDQAKTLALEQFNNGVDVGFSVAGSAGEGEFEAAMETNRYVFGVDSDQAALLPQYADYIPSSALKNIGNAIYRAIKLDLEETLPYGETETLGFLEGGVELADGGHYEAMLSETDRELLKDIQDKIITGDIQVSSALQMTPEEIQELKDSVQIPYTEGINN